MACLKRKCKFKSQH